MFQRIGYFFISLCFSTHSGSLISSTIASDKSINTYSSYSNNGMTSYLKSEGSGCVSRLEFRNHSSSVTLLYSGCDTGKDNLESADEIANSFLDIINYYNLEDVFKERKYLTINISWKISHWPIINAINTSDSWPKNIFDELYLSSTDENEIRIMYGELLKKEILRESVYLPFVISVEKFGCNMAISDDFADPLIIHGKKIMKDNLIKWGVFDHEEAKKDVYPLIKGPIEFSYSCQD